MFIYSEQMATLMDRPDGTDGAEGGGTLTDEELDAIASQTETRIAVVGCGGAGSNAVTRMFGTGVRDATLVAANTDAKHLQRETNADVKLLLGAGTSRGRGAGSVPKVGKQAAHESLADIEDAVGDKDLVFVTAGLGGGTGTGAAPVVAECASKHGALTVSVVTLPFTAEGQRRTENALAGLENLKRFSDTLLVIPNDRILDYAPELSLEAAFEVCDGVLMNSVIGIIDLVSKSSLVNVDFADVSNIMEDGGVSMIGFGEGSGETKCRDAVSAALQSPLLDVDINDAGAALIHVVGGPSMTVEEAEGAAERVYETIDPAAQIIWGASVDTSLTEKMETMVIITGVPDPESVRGREPARLSDDIDFVV